MLEDYYRVLLQNIVIADHMTIEDACVLVKALFEKYYQDPALKYSIERMREEHECKELPQVRCRG